MFRHRLRDTASEDREGSEHSIREAQSIAYICIRVTEDVVSSSIPEDDTVLWPDANDGVASHRVELHIAYRYRYHASSDRGGHTLAL